MVIDIKKCTVEELVQHFKLKLRGENIYCPSTPTPEQQEILKARKSEIMKFLIARKTKEIQQRQARAARIDAIPGLYALKVARQDVAMWREEFAKTMERGDSGVGLRPRPEYDFDELYAQYPRACAYFKAESWASAAHDVKLAAGEEAREAIIRGEDYNEAIEKMEKKWHDYCHEHVWD